MGDASQFNRHPPKSDPKREDYDRQERVPSALSASRSVGLLSAAQPVNATLTSQSSVDPYATLAAGRFAELS
jgi:hypothetical protein